MKELRNKCVPLVKVLWHNHSIEEVIWELKEIMRSQYPHLFPGKFQGKNFLRGRIITTRFPVVLENEISKSHFRKPSRKNANWMIIDRLIEEMH